MNYAISNRSKAWDRTKKVLKWPVWYLARIIRAFIPNAEQLEFRKWNKTTYLMRDVVLIAWVASSVFVSWHFAYVGLILFFFLFIKETAE